MTSRTLILDGSGSLTLKREELVKLILKLTAPEPGQIDNWAMGVFKEDPDEDCLTRQLVVFGKLKDCADAVAGCLTRKPKLPRSSRLRILSYQGEVPEIDCKSADFCF